MPIYAGKHVALRSIILAASLFMLQGFTCAFAITPENGMYWSPSRPSNLYVIEYQKGVMALVIYSYDAQGRPEWFTASGPLQQFHGGSELPADQAIFDAPLTRASGGPPLGTHTGSDRRKHQERGGLNHVQHRHPSTGCASGLKRSATACWRGCGAMKRPAATKAI